MIEPVLDTNALVESVPILPHRYTHQEYRRNKDRCKHHSSPTSQPFNADKILHGQPFVLNKKGTSNRDNYRSIVSLTLDFVLLYKIVNETNKP